MSFAAVELLKHQAADLLLLAHVSVSAERVHPRPRGVHVAFSFAGWSWFPYEASKAILHVKGKRTRGACLSYVCDVDSTCYPLNQVLAGDVQ